MEFFVGSLAYAVTASDLAAFVGGAVEVNAAMVRTDRDTDRSRGFGAVDVPDRAVVGTQAEGDEGSEDGVEQACEWTAPLDRQALLGRHVIISPWRASAGQGRPFLWAFRRALADDAPHVTPAEEQFRDVLDVPKTRAR